MRMLINNFCTLDFLLSIDKTIANFKKYCKKHNKEYIDNIITIGNREHNLIFKYRNK